MVHANPHVRGQSLRKLAPFSFPARSSQALGDHRSSLTVLDGVLRLAALAPKKTSPKLGARRSELSVLDGVLRLPLVAQDDGYYASVRRLRRRTLFGDAAKAVVVRCPVSFAKAAPQAPQSKIKNQKIKNRPVLPRPQTAPPSSRRLARRRACSPWRAGFLRGACRTARAGGRWRDWAGLCRRPRF